MTANSSTLASLGPAIERPGWSHQTVILESNLARQGLECKRKGLRSDASQLFLIFEMGAIRSNDRVTTFKQAAIQLHVRSLAHELLLRIANRSIHRPADTSSRKPLAAHAGLNGETRARLDRQDRATRVPANTPRIQYVQAVARSRIMPTQAEINLEESLRT
ncbi:hypothetical protein PMIN05_003236 [Paraphaeosphaeria minitans]